MKSTSRLLLCLVMLIGSVCLASAKETYVQDLTWGTKGSGDGQFAGNSGLSVSSGQVTVADTDNHRLQIFDSNGNYLRQFAASSAALPMAVVPTGTGYYVLSYGSSKVQIYNSIGIVMGSFGSEGSEPQQMQNPRGMALNPATNMIYIADTGNNRISQFTTGGVLVRTIGSEGSGDGQFQQPYGIALDAAGNLYVADRNNVRIQKFSSTGDYLCQWPMNVQGATDPPTCITVSGDHVFVGGAMLAVTKFTTSGAFVCRFGSAGTGTGQFSSVNGIAVDDAGRLFISDGGYHGCRIQRFVRNNTPTSPTSVVINPKPYSDGSNLTPKPLGATDPDGDPLTYRYQWFKSSNNLNWTKGPAKRVLLASQTSVGQYWRVRVVAWDGKSPSPAKVSGTIRIVADAAAAMTATALPTRGGASVTISLSTAADVQVTLSNLAGRQIAALPLSAAPAGVTTLHWNRLTSSGTKAAAGRYLLRATARSSNGSQSSATCWLNLR